MNLRILKKKSKQAAPLLAHFGVSAGDMFLAKRGENHIGGTVIMARKHWERGRSVHADCFGEHMIKRPARDGKGWVFTRPPYHPRKGTAMVGRVSGYYEPEWEERTAYEELRDLVYWSGGKPDSMSEDDWFMAQRITRTSPITDAEIAEWRSEI